MRNLQKGQSGRPAVWLLSAILVFGGPAQAQESSIEKGWSDFKKSLFSSDSGVDESDLTPEERSLRENRHAYIDNLVLKASLEKAAIAGGITLAGCLFLTEAKRKACIAAALGVGAGTFLYTKYVDSKRVKGKEDKVLQAEAMAADLEAELAALKKLNADARVVAVQNNQRVVALRRKIRSNQITMSNAQGERARIESNVNAVTDALDAGKKELAGWEDVLKESKKKGAPVRKLQRQIKQKRAEITKLEKTEDAMLDELQSIPAIEVPEAANQSEEDEDSSGGDR